MYVVVFEVLQREKSKEKVPGMAQLACVILGFSTLMLVEIFGNKLNKKIFYKITHYGKKLKSIFF